MSRRETPKHRKVKETQTIKNNDVEAKRGSRIYERGRPGPGRGSADSPHCGRGLKAAPLRFFKLFGDSISIIIVFLTCAFGIQSFLMKFRRFS